MDLLQSLDLIAPEWKKRLIPKIEPHTFTALNQFLVEELNADKNIFPSSENIFKAFQSPDLEDIKVVIMGQDPYHQKDQATGLSFAVPNDLLPKPPSLRNILKELATDIEISIPENQSDLTGWSSQGVFLFNTVLTVEESKPLSHQKKGWELFTEKVLECLNARDKPLVFILWGAQAHRLKSHLNLSKHRVIESVHPSPLSSYRGFFGSRPFTRANEALRDLGFTPIQWAKISNSD